MAKKRLNKKVALMGSTVFVLVAITAIGLFLYLSRDPHKFIKDGDAAVEAARQVTDQQQRKDQYNEAERRYKKAYGLAKTDELKVETLYRLVDVYMATDSWRNVLGSWSMIVRLDPKDMQARYNKLKFFYTVADTASGTVWQEVASQAAEFVEIIEKPGAAPDLATTDTSKWELDALKQKGEPAHRLGPYLYLIRGRANLETARLGMVTNKLDTLKQAVADLEKAKQLEPANVNVYLYLAQAAVVTGDTEASQGNLDAKKDGQNKAIELLREGIEATKDSVQANINLLGMKHFFARNSLAPDQQKQILALEPEYLALGSKFGSNAEILAALTDFYADFQLGPAYLDKAIETIEKAIALDKNNVDYALAAANLYSRRFNIHHQKQDVNKAISIAKKALSLPDTQETTGARSAVTRSYQVQLNILLVSSYLDQILNPALPLEEQEGQTLLAEAQQAVRQIEQILGSGDDPQVVKWDGMLELATATLTKQDIGAAIQKLYKTYTQLKASGRADPYLSYRLAKVFANSSESGAVGEFITNAIQNGIEMTQPEARLDYAEVLSRAGIWKAVLANISLFEERCGATDRSRILRISSHIGAKEFADAEQDLAQIPQQDPNYMMLKAAIMESQARQIRMIIERKEEKPRTSVVMQKILSPQRSQEAADLRSIEQLTADMKPIFSAFIEYMDTLLEKDPNSPGAAIAISMCEDAIATGQSDQANLIVDKLLKYQPDNSTAMFYKRLLAEPDPAKVPADKVKQIREDVVTKIADPVRRTIALGIFYQTNDEPNKAAEQFKKLAGISAGAETLQADEASRHRAISSLFDIALEKKDWETADKIAQISRQENLDDCSGNIFAARVALAKRQYESALASADNALAQRPVFGYGYLLRTRINAALGNETAALTDIQTAATINPMDRIIARELASRLYARNKKLGNNVSSSQLGETKNALDWAMALSPGDLELMSFYAEYISESEPDRAMALRQSLQETSPSLQNALLLARLATRLAMDSADTQRRQALLGIAASALDQAKSYDPQNSAVLDSYAEYYRLTGQEEKAEQLLTTSKEPRLLWQHYVKAGRFDDARKVLEKSYETNPKDVNTLRGLLFLAENTGDTKALTKYAEELLSAEDTADNHILLMQTYLNTGLVNEAKQKLAGFQEKYPTDGRGLLLGAWLYMRQGQMKEALETINKRLEGDQSDAIAWRLRGQINFTLAELDQAIMDLKRSKTLLDAAVTRVLLARVYVRAGRTEDAITELKSTIEDPQAPDEARNMLEQIYSSSGRKEALKDFYAKTLEQLPDSVYWHRRAAGFAGADGDFAKAEQLYSLAFQKSSQQGKPDPDALNGYFRVLIAAGKSDKLLDEAAKYIDDPNLAPVAYIRMAEAKNKLGDRASAAQYCRKAIDKAANNIDVAVQMLQTSTALLGSQETEQICSQMLTAQPDSFPANWAMYNLCRIKGDYNKAIEYIDQCIKTSSQNQLLWFKCTLQKADALTMAYSKTSDNNYLQRAMEIYQSLLAKMPNNTGVLNNLAYLLAENNQDIDKAMEYAKQAYEAMPDNAMYLDTYAFVLYKKGRHADAVQFGQAAIQEYEAQRVPVPPEVYEHLGQSQEQLGEAARALTAYQQALEAGGENMPKTVKDKITAAIERLSKTKGNDSNGQ
ncbi:MAG: tetratricopeptide repeat protein [Sedimentisphaerales bacterium]|jgi:tetratricopeptide (TPR) repeat protein